MVFVPSILVHKLLFSKALVLTTDFLGEGGAAREHEEYNFLGPNVSQCVQLVVGLVAFS